MKNAILNNFRSYCIYGRIYIYIYSNIYIVMDSTVLGGVAEVVSSNPRVDHKIFFSIYRHS